MSFLNCSKFKNPLLTAIVCICTPFNTSSVAWSCTVPAGMRLPGTSLLRIPSVKNEAGTFVYNCMQANRSERSYSVALVSTRLLNSSILKLKFSMPSKNKCSTTVWTSEGASTMESRALAQHKWNHQSRSSFRCIQSHLEDSVTLNCRLMDK